MNVDKHIPIEAVANCWREDVKYSRTAEAARGSKVAFTLIEGWKKKKRVTNSMRIR